MFHWKNVLALACLLICSTHLSRATAASPLQTRLQALQAAGVVTHSYAFAKAQAWLDFAKESQTQGDHSEVVDAASAQAQMLIEHLEQKTSIDLDTPLIAGAKKIRPDLWSIADSLKFQPDFSCAEADTARLEVQLVLAGRAQKTLGWRYAKPYIQAAERLARKAEAKTAICASTLASAPNSVAPENLPPEVAAKEDSCFEGGPPSSCPRRSTGNGPSALNPH